MNMHIAVFHANPCQPPLIHGHNRQLPKGDETNMIRINIEALCTLQPRFADFSYATAG